MNPDSAYLAFTLGDIYMSPKETTTQDGVTMGGSFIGHRYKYPYTCVIRHTSNSSIHVKVTRYEHLFSVDSLILTLFFKKGPAVVHT